MRPYPSSKFLTGQAPACCECRNPGARSARRAEALCLRALAIHENALGPDHPDVASVLGSMGHFKAVQGLFDQAEPLLVRALAIYEKVLVPNHPSIATTLNNLAEVCRENGEYARAEPLYARAAAIRQKNFGPDHPLVATDLNNLAMLYTKLCRRAEAEPLLQRALAINEKVFGPDHSRVAKALNNVGTNYLAQGQYDRAEPLLVRALQIKQSTLGPDHIEIAIGLSNLARARQGLEKTIESRQGFDDGIAMFKRLQPDGSPDLARILWRSASARLDNKDAAAALPELEEAVALAEKFLKPEHPDLKEYRDTLAKCREVIDK